MPISTQLLTPGLVGAVTCRAESLKLEQIAVKLDVLGIRRVAIVHEWVRFLKMANDQHEYSFIQVFCKFVHLSGRAPVLVAIQLYLQS